MGGRPEAAHRNRRRIAVTADRLIAGGHERTGDKVLVRAARMWQNQGMKEIVREASARWNGGRKRATARVSTGRGVFRPAKFLLEIARDPRAEADAAELLAAAHAISFCAALSHELRASALRQGRIAVTVAATLAHAATGWTIIHIHLTVTARLPGVRQERFIDAAIAAKKECIASRSLRTNISMNAKLEDSPASRPRRRGASG